MLDVLNHRDDKDWYELDNVTALSILQEFTKRLEGVPILELNHLLNNLFYKGDLISIKY